MEFTSIYGAIAIDRDYEKSVLFLKSLGKDSHYPFINTSMFSFGDYEIPYYYDNMMLSFGATYKNFGYDLTDWNKLILKIEHILRNIGVEIAQFHIDSYVGDYTLTWIHKEKYFHSKEEHLSDLYQLQKTDDWYFGYGKRSMFTGSLDQDLKFYDKLDQDNFGFTYPVLFTEEARSVVQKVYHETAALPVGSAVKVKDGLELTKVLSDRINEILYSFMLEGSIMLADNYYHQGDIIIKKQPWYSSL